MVVMPVFVPVFMPVLVLVLIVVVIIIVVVLPGTALDFRNPGSGSSHLVEIELAGIDELVQIHVTEIALQDFSAGVQGGDYLLHAREFFRLDGRSFVEQHYVAELYLFYHQALQILFAYVRLLKGIAAGELALHPQGVNHGNDAVQFGIDELLGAYLGHRADGLGDGAGFADAAGFDHYVIELVHLAELGELRHKVHLQGAADASVLQGHQRIVGITHDAALLYELGIDIHFADVIHYDGELDSFLICKDAVKGCLAASQVSGHQKYRYLLFFQINCHFVTQEFSTLKSKHCSTDNSTYAVTEARDGGRRGSRP